MNNFRGDITSDEIVEWLQKVQNIPVEQSNKDLEEVAKEYVKENCILPEDCNDGDNPYYEECTATVFKDGAKWQKEQTINKACEWLKENIYNRVYKCNDGLGFPTAAFLEEFKKAMEDE